MVIQFRKYVWLMKLPYISAYWNAYVKLYDYMNDISNPFREKTKGPGTHPELSGTGPGSPARAGPEPWNLKNWWGIVKNVTRRWTKIPGTHFDLPLTVQNRPGRCRIHSGGRKIPWKAEKTPRDGFRLLPGRHKIARDGAGSIQDAEKLPERPIKQEKR